MRRKILIILLIILVLAGIILTIMYFDSKHIDNTVVDSHDKYSDEDLPMDTGYDDNKKLYGSWNSVYTEIYRDGKLNSKIDDTNNMNVQINVYDKMNVCSVDNGGLNCSSEKYTFVDGLLYVTGNTFLSGKREVYFEDEYMVVKSIINNEESYILLYFIKN